MITDLRTMGSMDNYLSKLYPEPPLIAFRRPKNIKDKVVRAKLLNLQIIQRGKSKAWQNVTNHIVVCVNI